MKSLYFLLAYFNNRKQKKKDSVKPVVAVTVTFFSDIILGFPQGLILGSLLFIIYIGDSFIEYVIIEFV